jgi:hypothetical protein
MAANGFPTGEREGGLKSPRRGIPEPLGEVLMFFTSEDQSKKRSRLKTQIWRFLKKDDFEFFNY